MPSRLSWRVRCRRGSCHSRRAHSSRVTSCFIFRTPTPAPDPVSPALLPAIRLRPADSSRREPSAMRTLKRGGQANKTSQGFSLQGLPGSGRSFSCPPKARSPAVTSRGGTRCQSHPLSGHGWTFALPRRAGEACRKLRPAGRWRCERSYHKYGAVFPGQIDFRYSISASFCSSLRLVPYLSPACPMLLLPGCEVSKVQPFPVVE